MAEHSILSSPKSYVTTIVLREQNPMDRSRKRSLSATPTALFLEVHSAGLSIAAPGEDHMRIAKIEDLHCNAGWRDFSFLKITTDDGLVGWAEFMENFGAEGLSGVIARLGERLIGMDPRPVEKITAFLHGLTRQTPYGINQQ